MFTDPAARAEWEALGVGVVPVAALGDRWIALYHVDQLRGFLGLPPAGDRAGYQDYVAALARVLEAIERSVRQVPDEHQSTPTPNRGRDIRELAFNIHDPIVSMMRSLDSGEFLWDTDQDFDRSRQFATIGQLADFCRDVRITWIERASLIDEEEASGAVETERGAIEQRQLLEAQAVHAARHLRQVIDFLQQIGVEPKHELSAVQLVPIRIGEIVY